MDRSPRHVLFGLTRYWRIAGWGWGAVCVVGLSLFWQYKATGEQPRKRTRSWPEQTAIALDQHELTLLMFLHPRCPCTRASLHEFERVLRESGKSRPTFVVYQPAEADSAWQTSPLLVAIREIPGAAIVWDGEGEIAARFGAMTSGQVQLYRPTGECLFNGGITRLRGHEGANAASERLLAALQGMPTELIPTVVYGCAIQAGR